MQAGTINCESIATWPNREGERQAMTPAQEKLSVIF